MEGGRDSKRGGGGEVLLFPDLTLGVDEEVGLDEGVDVDVGIDFDEDEEVGMDEDVEGIGKERKGTGVGSGMRARDGGG